MTDIIDLLPLPLGGGGTTAQLSSNEYDLSIGGVGFLLRPTDSTPYQRANDQVTKQQVDQSNEAGEQSLSSWWVRSQSNWDRGAGVTWYEPGHDENTQDRYHASQGIDPWTEGTFSLLHAMTDHSQSVTFTQPLYLSTTNVGGDGYVLASGTSVRRRTATGSVVATLPGVAGQQALGGGFAWVPCGTAGLVKWDYTAGSKTATVTGTVNRCWWLKGRLIVASTNKLYEVASTYAGAITGATLVYTHPDANFTWVDADATADAILAAGYSGSESIIVAFQVTNDPDTGIPVLNSGREVARMPFGEQITAMGTYLSGYIVLGTTAGVRAGQIGSNGQVQYGLLSVKTPSAVTDVTFWDRFAYLPVSNAFPDGTSGVVRLDLSQQIGNDGSNQFAWAWDVGPGVAGTANSICMYGNTDRPVVAVGLVPYLTSATDYVSEGYLDMGQVRYGTTENKAFMYARATGNLYNGKAQLLALDKSGGEHGVITYGPSTGIGQDGSVDIPGLTITSWLGFRVRLYPDNSITLTHPAPTTPVITGIGVKALPAPKPTRLVQYPLSCFDFEETPNNQELGFSGRAWWAVQGLEAAQDQATPLFVQDRRTGEAFVGTIESLTFTGVAASDRDNANYGGMLVVQMRMSA